MVIVLPNAEHAAPGQVLIQILSLQLRRVYKGVTECSLNGCSGEMWAFIARKSQTQGHVKGERVKGGWLTGCRWSHERHRYVVLYGGGRGAVDSGQCHSPSRRRVRARPDVARGIRSVSGGCCCCRHCTVSTADAPDTTRCTAVCFPGQLWWFVNAQNPLDTFPRSFPVDGAVACILVGNLLRTCYGETGVMDFGLNRSYCCTQYMIGYWHDTVICSSVHLSLSVTKCILALMVGIGD